jgi:hypothetical protein
MIKISAVLSLVMCFSFGYSRPSAWAGGPSSTVLSSTDLTTPFHTKGIWYLVISQGPDFAPPIWPKDGPLSLCFEQQSDTVCSPEKTVSLDIWHASFPTSPVLLPSFLAYLKGISIVPQDKVLPFPLLVVRLESMNPGPGSPGGPFIFVYKPKLDSFELIFQDSTAHNQNQEIRVVQGGPLSGDVIEAGPCNYPACHHAITVYRLTHNARYIKVLEFRGKSRYDDGDPRPAIDADMPEILKLMHAG